MEINTPHEQVLKKHEKLLLTGFYQVEKIKSKSLFNSIKDAVGLELTYQ